MTDIGFLEQQAEALLDSFTRDTLSKVKNIADKVEVKIKHQIDEIVHILKIEKEYTVHMASAFTKKIKSIYGNGTPPATEELKHTLSQFFDIIKVIGLGAKYVGTKLNLGLNIDTTVAKCILPRKHYDQSQMVRA